MKRKEFLESFEKSREPISVLYMHLFSCMEHDEIELLLSELKKSVIKEDWFHGFHKSMRQVDFINNTYTLYHTNEQTQSDIEEMEKLKTILPMYKEKGAIWSDVVKIKEAINKGSCIRIEKIFTFKKFKKSRKT